MLVLFLLKLRQNSGGFDQAQILCCKFLTRLCCSVSWPSELLETRDIFTQRQHPDLARGSYSGEHPSLRSIRPFCTDAAETGHASGRFCGKTGCQRTLSQKDRFLYQFSKSPRSQETRTKERCMSYWRRLLACAAFPESWLISLSIDLWLESLKVPVI